MSRPNSVTDSPVMLIEGQRLDQPAFHALYEATPPGTRVELVGGVVYMPSPVGREHAKAQVPVIVWLSYYAESTPGVEVRDNAAGPAAGSWSETLTVVSFTRSLRFRDPGRREEAY